MDPRLLRLYSDELTHLREVGAEFARDFPRIAARLGMSGVEVDDPYVERLLEGFAFLAARVQLKLEAEYPRLVEHLLEAVYPNFLAPVPSMMIVQLQPDPTDPNLAQGARVPRGSAIVSTQARGQGTSCEFRTAQEVRLWPIEVAQAQYFSFAPDLPLNRLPGAGRVKGGLRLKLRALAGNRFAALPIDELVVHICAPDDVAFRLHELALGTCTGSWVRPADGEPGPGWRGPDSVQPVGYADDEALLPQSERGFSGYRLLQEYAAMPQRFLSLRVTGLAQRLARVSGDEAELVLMFSRGDAALEPLVDASSVALFCTPAINLFPKRLDRIQLQGATWEHHVVPDRTRPMDFEVHHLTSVTGYGTGVVAEQSFQPLYGSRFATPREDRAYYTVRRELRVMSAKQKQEGPRSSYIGTECFLALVDGRQAPYREDLRQLALNAMVSNRDLPLLLPAAGSAGADSWQLDAPGTMARPRCLRGPTRPHHRQPRGDLGWQLVSHLSLNYLSIADDDPAKAAAAVRSLLALYGPAEDPAWQRQMDALQGVQAQRVVRRLPFGGPLTFGTGIEITTLVDELALQGASAFLLGSVLEQFFARHAALNTFTETVLASTSRGELMRWAPRVGAQALL